MPGKIKVGQGDTYEGLIDDVAHRYKEVKGQRKVYLVKGKLVGYGSDNEPLLKNVCIVKQISQ